MERKLLHIAIGIMIASPGELVATPQLWFLQQRAMRAAQRSLLT